MKPTAEALDTPARLRTSPRRIDTDAISNQVFGADQAALLRADTAWAAVRGVLVRAHLSAMTTPVIEVAADGRAARGVWMSPGHATDNRQGRFVGRWRWLRFAGDFTVENSTWKIWHLRLHGIFATPYDRSWAETAQESELTGGPPPPPSLPPELAPDRPPHPFWVYGTRTEYDPEPLPPEPYETWS